MDPFAEEEKTIKLYPINSKWLKELIIYELIQYQD